MKTQELIALLEEEMKPALGVTEVGAIALACARAKDLTEGEIQSIKVALNGGMYKNAFSCAIPNTEEIGNEMAAALGALAGDWTLGLEVLQSISTKELQEARDFVSKGKVTVEVLPQKTEIFIKSEVVTNQDTAVVEIRDTHANIVYLEKNGEVLLQDQGKEKEKSHYDFDSLSIVQLYEFVDTVEISKISFLKKMITMNERLSREGAKGVGLRISSILKGYETLGDTKKDLISMAQQLTCDAMDARLSGLPLPAMSIAGSGSHGILCSLPVVSYAQQKEIGEEALLRALALSAFITIYSKHYTGRLSPLCGCVLGGGTGACAGILYLMGATVKEIGNGINHMAANLTGMICDGGNLGCSLKAASGVHAAYLSAMLAKKGVAIPKNFGIIGSTPEQTIYNLGRISGEGMTKTDNVMIDIMKKGK